MNVRKAIILTAGYGTRFLPATKAVPKALLPLIDKPAIQYLVEEAVASGIRDIVVVTNPNVTAIQEHFSPSPELERWLEQRGDHHLLDQVRHLCQIANITYTYQDKPRGIADAVMSARDIIRNEPFVLFFVDDIINSSVPATQQLIGVFERQQGSVLAVEAVPPEEISGYGIVAVEPLDERTFRVLDLIEKPAPEEAPSNLGLVGRYVITPEIFDVIPHTPAGKGGEIQITDALALLRQEQPIYAYKFEGRRYDTGRPLGMLLAALELACQRPDLADVIRSRLRLLGSVSEESA